MIDVLLMLRDTPYFDGRRTIDISSISTLFILLVLLRAPILLILSISTNY